MKKIKTTDNVDIMELALKDCKKLPLIKDKKEFDELYMLERKTDDSEIKEMLRNKLIIPNGRYVASVAEKTFKKSRLSTLTQEDLFQLGMIGLCKAYEKYNPKKKAKFLTYANWWVRQEIMRGIYERDRNVYITSKGFSNLIKIINAESELEMELERQPKAKEIALLIGMNPEEVERLMSLSNDTSSLDSPIYENGDVIDDIVDVMEGDYNRGHVQFDEIPPVEDMVKKSGIPDREKQIIKEIFYDGMTLKESAEIHGLTKERIRQLKEHALYEIREFAFENKKKSEMHLDERSRQKLSQILY